MSLSTIIRESLFVEILSFIRSNDRNRSRLSIEEDRNNEKKNDIIDNLN